MADYRVISSDNHVLEPADLWTSRADKSLKDRMPIVESLEDGDWWYADGRRIMGTGVGQVGVRFEDREKLKRAISFEELRPEAGTRNCISRTWNKTGWMPVYYSPLLVCCCIACRTAIC